MDSTSRQSKTVAQNFINALDSRNFDVLPSLFTDTAGWWVMGQGGGYFKVIERIPLCMQMLGQFSQYSLKAFNIVAEGVQVMAELEETSTSQDGKVCTNSVVMAFTCRGKQILLLREYLDSQQLLNVMEESGSTAVTMESVDAIGL
ncbi:Putative limonene-1,2-epoxide hydrolase, NTF2-like domain superfamily [Septoria linicola]|uniref:Limonene-1,2-epoxide hydrolase, NTF2-like domain superfamily n=1 Tax=Septoria linicola TaxID=215465 RepID=A0A9Q9ALQ6_9PEZI|nr:putative limonene-1,2-epoxide hydrolase, NTF2-like domain superfamily [Septoria linicola]USW49283.1 Putative limonene-1,2-epoxide hydrolase, NTF2-like domain superfamily [Septoria linicola]